jgi:hypothetical protein
MQPHRHQGDQAGHGIGARPLALGIVKVLAVVLGAGNPQGHTVHGIYREATPPDAVSTLVCPIGSRMLEEPRHRLVTEPGTGLRNGAGRYGRISAAGKCAVQLVDDLDDRPIPGERLTENKPDNLFRWQPPATHQDRSGWEQRFIGPLPPELRGECWELPGPRSFGGPDKVRGDMHSNNLRRTRRATFRSIEFARMRPPWLNSRVRSLASLQMDRH